jgi:uncharacterized protein (TIGR01370 family)
MTLPFLYQLQDADYASLAQTDFRVAVIDPDDSALTSSQVRELQEDQGKILYAYTSIGEAEDYRDYWTSEWTASVPNFILGENEDWAGNYRVEFWNSEWQAIVYDRIDDLLEAGYNGAYLDIVDGYTVDEVIAAYPGTDAELRQEMIDFVIEISKYAKAQNPDFDIIPQNAVGLLGVSEDGPEGGANMDYINAIDGLGVEDLWFNDNQTSTWTSGDLEYIELASNAGLFVLATSYPTQNGKQETFIENAIVASLIPFVAERDLTGEIDAANAGVDALLDTEIINTPWSSDSTLIGGAGRDVLAGGAGADLIAGHGGNDVLSGGRGDDVIKGHSGKDTLSGNKGADKLLGGLGDDTLFGGDGGDAVFGHIGADVLFGGKGNDTLYGGQGSDNLNGNRGADKMHGGSGRDVLRGSEGNDVLNGGKGNDTLYGGSGADQFVFSKHSGIDVVKDFNSDTDRLKIIGEVNYETYATGSGVMFEFADGRQIKLEGVSVFDVDDVNLTFM